MALRTWWRRRQFEWWLQGYLGGPIKQAQNEISDRMSAKLFGEVGDGHEFTGLESVVNDG